MIITKHVIDLIECPDAPTWMTENNAYGLTEKEVLDMLQAQNSSFLPFAKGGFKNAKPIIIKESGSYTLGDYLVTLTNGDKVTCKTLDEANAVKLTEQEKLLAIQNPNFVVNHVVINENGDHVWAVIDLETTTETNNFQVFNPATGQYVFCNTIEEAKATFADIKNQILNGFYVQVQQLITGTSGDTDGDAAWFSV